MSEILAWICAVICGSSIVLLLLTCVVSAVYCFSRHYKAISENRKLTLVEKFEIQYMQNRALYIYSHVLQYIFVTGILSYILFQL